MRWRSVRAILLQDFFITKHSLEIFFDIFFYSFASLIIFGYISLYLSQGNNIAVAQDLLIAVIFWEVIRINQYSTSVSSLWNVWSHNTSNMFIAPLKTLEYLTAHIISATMKSASTFITASIIAYFVFKVNILSLGLFPVIFSYINMVIFATAVGLVLIGLVFQFGTKVQAITWGFIFLIQPFCAVYFPVNSLPQGLQWLAHCFPVTYFFEWLRTIHGGGAFSRYTILAAFLFNIVYLVAGAKVFSLQIAASKRSGQLVRNDL